ncbi:MAG: rRNA pseudouridine synthase [Propionibacteriaceae bacterium]|jgi:23S rRNA pseudouridine2605 synthase|nr:rRNA pseudouridine synthase [Propionibacteriaceae bacterium]
MAEPVRLQKALADAGVASRRAAEQLIAEGRVEVNGAVVAQQGTRVDTDADAIRVDGRRLPPTRPHVYFALNKPVGVLSSMEPSDGRPTLADYAKRLPRVFHVGRLDADTSGLLLLTNDGDLAQRLSHPSYEVPKTYLAQVAGLVEPKTVARLRRGVELDDGPLRPDDVKVLQTTAKRSLVRVKLHSGRNRVVRRLFEAVGHPVVELSRTAIGPVSLAGLKSGQLRQLTRDELGALFDLVGL